MLLPGFPKAKTVCTTCWERFTQHPDGVLAGDDTFLTDFPDPVILQNLSELATAALTFLERDQCYYPWKVVYQCILSGYIAYKNVYSLSLELSLASSQ